MIHRALLALVAVVAFAANSAPAEVPAGTWLGNLALPGGMSLRVVFKIERLPDGTLKGTLDSPDQGALGIPVTKAALAGDTLRLEVASVAGSYEGILEPDGQVIKGTWRQSGTASPLDLQRVEKVEPLRRPQEPRKPYPYREEEVSINNKPAGVKLAGTLTLPAGRGPYPAVILISGSGPQDRNEELMGHKPFLVLADYLTRRGIAVLRVDDRGFGKSTGSFRGATTEDFASDALAEVAFLKARRDIDRRHIGLLGHSEGGLIAPMVAVQSPDVSFLVLLAAPGVKGEEILYTQGAAIERAMGASDSAVARGRADQQATFALIKVETDSTALNTKLRQLLEDEIANLPPEERAQIGEPGPYIEMQMKMLTSSWFRFFLAYDPVPTLEKVKVPVLALTGQKDLQVDAKINLKAIELALQRGGNQDYSVNALPGLNHLFQTAKTGAPAEYAKIEETISPIALEEIATWILRHVK